MKKMQISKLAIATFMATKNTLKTTLLLCSVVTMLSAPVTTAHAGFLDKAMGDKLGILSNSTSADTFKSASRNVISGGSMYVHNKIFNRSIVSFTAPGFNAGCGGLDLFGGSFSFINADQLVQLFRSIAQNAAGFLFMIAISTISEAISTHVKWFQDLVQKINNLLSNSCKLAQGLVVGGIGAMRGDAEQKKHLNQIQSDAGDIWDTMSKPPKFSDMLNGISSGAAESKNADGSVDKQSNFGNFTVKACKKLEGNNLFSSNTKDRYGEIMSVVGAVIKNHQKGGTYASATGGTNSVDQGIKPDYKDALIRLKDLVVDANGSPELKGYKCDDDTDCLNPQIATLDKLTKGYMYYEVMRRLCGTGSGVGSGTNEYNTQCNSGILQAFASPANMSLTDSDKQFLASMPNGIYKYFAKLSKNDKYLSGSAGYNRTYAEKLGRSLAAHMASETLLDVITNIRKGVSGIDIAKDEMKEVTKRIKQAENDIYTDLQDIYQKYGDIASLSADGERWANEQARQVNLEFSADDFKSAGVSTK